MVKVEERVDLSKKVLEIDVNQEMFAGMLRDFNNEIMRCIRDVYDEKFEAGEITVKLNIEIPVAYETFQRTDKETGELMDDTYKYRKPLFEHKITTTMKKQYKQEGGYTDKRDVKFEDGKWIAVPVKEAQRSIFDRE